MPDYYTVPANREITVRDLLTHTSGLESGNLGNRVGARIAPRDTSKTLADQVPKLAAGAAGLPARIAVDLQPAGRHGHAVADRRDRVGTDLRRVPEAAALRPARHEGHRIRRPRRQGGARRRRSTTARRRDWNGRTRRPGSRPRRSSPVAADCGPPRRTTRSSRRCSSTAAN